MELRQSAQDVRDMREDESVEYKYEILNTNTSGLKGPGILFTGQNANGDNVFTMYVEKNIGSYLHEGRHGGDIARRTLELNAQGGYGVSHEISAYRAEYSWSGYLKFIDINKTPTQIELINSAQSGVNPLLNTIYDINKIDVNFINLQVDPGLIPIYPPASIPLNIWNSN